MVDVDVDVEVLVVTWQQSADVQAVPLLQTVIGCGTMRCAPILQSDCKKFSEAHDPN